MPDQRQAAHAEQQARSSTPRSPRVDGTVRTPDATGAPQSARRAPRQVPRAASRSAASTSPSPTLSATLPVKPSHTITSARPVNSSRASMFPMKFRPVFRSRAWVSRMRSLPFSASSPIESNADTRPFDLQGRCRVRRCPSWRTARGARDGTRGWRRRPAGWRRRRASASSRRAQGDRRPADGAERRMGGQDGRPGVAGAEHRGGVTRRDRVGGDANRRLGACGAARGAAPRAWPTTSGASSTRTNARRARHRAAQALPRERLPDRRARHRRPCARQPAPRHRRPRREPDPRPSHQQR